jgi:hypothetical protein
MSNQTRILIFRFELRNCYLLRPTQSCIITRRLLGQYQKMDQPSSPSIEMRSGRDGQGGRKQVNAQGAKVDAALDDMRITNRSLGNVPGNFDMAGATPLRRRRDTESKVTPASKDDATPKIRGQIGEPSADHQPK